jgi:voltage-gated potassium channel Kch
VIPLFIKLIKEGQPLTVTDPNMTRRWRTVGWVAVVLSLSTSLAQAFLDSGRVDLISHFLNAAVLLLAMVMVVGRILGHSRVTISTVLGGVLAYALLAFAMGTLYEGIDLATDEPFFLQGEAPAGSYTYFSLIVITTVGFGDFSPGTDLAQRLVAMEAFLGQVFLVVLVARLVSLWEVPSRGRRTGNHADSADEAGDSAGPPDSDGTSTRTQ